MHGQCPLYAHPMLQTSKNCYYTSTAVAHDAIYIAHVICADIDEQTNVENVKLQKTSINGIQYLQALIIHPYNYAIKQ